MKRAYSVKNVIAANFKTMRFGGVWRAAIGDPELTGSWIIYGAPKNGKTSFAMQLSKMLTAHGRVAYNSVEEGLSQSIREAVKRTEMIDCTNWNLLDKEEMPAMIERLQKQRSPDVIVIDSIQFMELKFSEYKRLKKMFPDKLFIYISHIEGGKPEGNVAQRIWRDANVAFRIEGFKAFPVGRYGGGEAIIINQERALAYWGE